jgi:hypothetical protein
MRSLGELCGLDSLLEFDCVDAEKLAASGQAVPVDPGQEENGVV